MENFISSISFTQNYGATYVISLIISVVLSIPITKGCFYISNNAPAKWFCDYNETPTYEMLNKIRFKYSKYGLIANVSIALAYIALFTVYGVNVYSVLLCLIATVLLLVTMSDAKYQIIPDQYTIAIALLCIVAGIIDLTTNKIFVTAISDIILGAGCGILLPIIINLLSVFILKKEGLGFGDVKLLGALGALFGFPYIFALIIVAVFVALFYIIYMVIRRKADEMYMAFGPFIAIGSVVLLVLINVINKGIHLYISMLM